MNRRYLPVLCAASMLWTACGSKGTTPETASAQTSKPVPVSTAVAVSREVSADFEETGSFVADESSDIAPPVAGRVIATPVDVGQRVRRGQVVCELDHRDAELKLQQARALLEEATAGVRQAQSRIGLSGGTFDPTKVPEVAAALANYQSAQAQAKMAAADATRYANLIATGDVSRSAYEKSRTQQETAEAQANAAHQQYEAALNSARQSNEGISTSQASLESVRAQLAQAQKGLSDTTIRAPFDGYITARPVAAGEYVALSSKIATIVRIGTLKLQLQAPEQQAAVAQIGMTVMARVSAYPDREFEGKVRAVNPSVDPNSRVFLIEAQFSNPGTELKPGMFARARVLLPGGTTGVFIPKNAIVRDKTTDSNQVYVIQNGKARLRVVATGDASGDAKGGLARILSGISAGDVVATGGQNDLFDGAPVEVRPASR